MIKRLITISILASALSTGCVIKEEGTSTDFDQQLLTEYRRAVPSLSQMEAAQVQGSTKEASAQALGDLATLPVASYPIVEGINNGVAELIGTLDTIVNTPPTLYNSDTLEFVWGPYENDDGVGYVAVYIRDTGANEDFRYHYAFLRGVDNDLANLTPVIVGGATPGEEEDHGVGLALYDFEANYEFEQTHNPNAGDLTLERGRIAFLVGAGPDEDAPQNEAAFVVAMFRNFVAADEPNAAPVDIEYMYGRYIDNAENHTLDFLNWKAPIDVDDNASSPEDVDIRMAFFDEGTGRAEALVTGGDLEAGASATLNECWDTAIAQTFVRFEYTGGPVLYQEGLEENCGVFAAGLAALAIPSLDDIEPDLRNGLSALAETGEFSE